MKFLRNKKLAVQIGILTSIITITGMLLLWGLVSYNVSTTVKTNLTNQMTDAVQARASIIDEYVTSAEEYLMAFALGDEVQNLLHNPKDQALRKRAQKYTEDFAGVKGIFEGLYIATPETFVLTHISQEAIGIYTRKGESLKFFKENILSKPTLTNLGIMKSPGTGALVISMYYPIFENKQCIGYVGAGVFASNLMDSLLELDVNGLPNNEYVFIDTETGFYIYNENEALINTATTDIGYQEILKYIRSNKNPEPKNYTYQDENDVKQLVVYKYLQERNWVFMVRDNADEAYNIVDTIRFEVGIVCIAIIVLIIIFLFLMVHRIAQDVLIVETVIGQLVRLELTAKQELSSLYDRGDEIGMIVVTTHELCEHLRRTIDDIGRILSEMANGNVTVDVSCNEGYYIGDFQILTQSLKTIRTKLFRLIRNISQVSSNLTSKAELASQNTVSLSQGNASQASSIARLTKNVDDITTQIHSGAKNCTQIQELADQTALHTSEANEKMTNLTNAMDNAANSSKKIEKIIKVIEDIASQTNILALNAAVEASRAGTVGKGFAVVADEIRSLAAKSTAAAKDTADLINQSINDINVGTETTTQVAKIMQIIDECTFSIKEQIHEIADTSTRQSDMITSVSKEIEEISLVAQNNFEAVNQNESTMQELSEQAKMLNAIVGQFQAQSNTLVL